MVAKKLRLFLLLILLPATVCMLLIGMQQYRHTAVAQNSRADASTVAACTGNKNCKACRNCSSCKHCKQEKGFCGACK